MIVPFVRTPNWLYIGPCGFFFTEMIGSWKVVFNSGCVTLTFFILNAAGLMNLSIFGGLRVNPSPTNVAFVIIRFQHFFCLLPDFITLKISSWARPLTCGSGTLHLPAFSLRFSFTMFDRTLLRFGSARSIKYGGKALPSLLTCPAPSPPSFAIFWSCIRSFFFISIFSTWRRRFRILALRPRVSCAFLLKIRGARASFFL